MEANAVLIRKEDGPMRICVDFTDISNACPKDNHPLLEIRLKIKSLGDLNVDLS